MRRSSSIIILVAIAMISAAFAETYSIPPEKVDGQKIFWGSAARFDKPAKVDYEKIVKATPEYGEIKKQKIESGSAKYWIQLSKASDHAVKVISRVGQNTDYDFICAIGYLGSLEPPIQAEDITPLVLKRFEEETER